MGSYIGNLHNLFVKEHDRFILWLPVLLGIGIGIYFFLPFEPSIQFTSIAIFTFSVGSWVFWNNINGRLFFLALLIIFLGIFRAEIRTIMVAAPVLQEEIFFRSIEGRISDIQIKEKGEKLILDNVSIEGIGERKTPEYISVSLKDVMDGLEVGDVVKLHATLFPPPTPVMPRAYDFARMFYYQKLGAVGYSPKEPELVKKAQANDFDKELNRIRLSITNRILAPMNEENGWIAAAMMVGEMSGVPKDTADVMRESGIYHVLSISGLHMSLAAMLVFVTVRFLLSLFPPLALRLPVKKIAAVIALCSSYAYLMLAGYPVPAVRSFIMIASVMVAILFDRMGISVYSLAWAAVITLLWQPESLLGASFQLSFAATLGILALYEKFGSVIYKGDNGFLYRIWLYFLGIMITSLIATLATTPLVIYHFNRFTLWGIAANMLLLPLVSILIMPSAVIALLLMPFGAEYYPLLALDSGIELMMRGARLFSGLPYAAISLPPPSFFGIIITVIGGLWLCIWQQKWRIWGVIPIILGMMTIWLNQPYDLLVSSDASKVALRLDSGQLLFLRGKESSFDAQVWLRVHGLNNGLARDDLDEKMGNCDKNKCVVSAYGKKIIVTRGKKEIEASCDGDPDIVISHNYLDENPSCANVPLLLDKARLERDGATGLRFKDGKVYIENSKEYRGQRPWVNN